MKRLFCLGMVLLLAVMVTFVSQADVESKTAKLSLVEQGYLSGWMYGNLSDEDDDYELMPFIMRFGYNVVPLTEKVSPDALVIFEVEPFLSPVFGPETNLELGCNLLMKYMHALTEKVSPYFEVGTGLLYTSQTFKNQSTHVNSIVQGGVGLHYFLRDDFAFNLGYRYRHFSNAGVKKPNGGVDTHAILFGFSFFY